MKKQHGGLKKRNLHKSPIQSLIDMIRSPGASLTLRDIGSSSNGIIVFLDVQPEYTEYDGYDPHTKKFTKNVTRFVIKFAITSDDTDDLYFKGIIKYPTTQESFSHEAEMQQRIWKKSLPIEICPSVASCMFLDHNAANRFLEIIGISSELYTILDGYLNHPEKGRGSPEYDDVFKSGLGLGILLMPAITPSLTIRDALRESDNYPAILIAQIVRLFLFFKVIDFDLHSGNALLFRGGPFDYNAIIIDFGIISDMSMLIDDNLTIRERNIINITIQGLKIKFLRFFKNSNDREKIKLMLFIMNYLSMWDRNKEWQREKKGHILKLLTNGKLQQADGRDGLFIPVPTYVNGYPKITDHYQMSWFEQIKQNRFASNIFLKSFEFLSNIYLHYKPIKIAKTDKSFYTGISSEVLLAELPVQQCIGENLRRGCTIMGGKRKSKKSKKSKKTRKIRNKYKNKN
jgi:hypothetical protein